MLVKERELDKFREYLKEYYGRKLKKTADLKESACCTTDTMRSFEKVLPYVPQEAQEKYYGCGSPIPEDFLTLKGLHAADFGSGAGLDAMILRFFLGPHGSVTGIDMTEEQLAVARKTGAEFIRNMNYDPKSLVFNNDFIELADSIPDESVDLVISNCVVNLSPEKRMVYHSMNRVLKPGGEVYISDIVSDRRNPHLASDEELVAECIGLAPYVNDAKDMMEDAGFRDVRTYSISELPKNSQKLRKEPAKFFKVVWRGFKLPLDRRCEDYGQFATYNGGLPSSPVLFKLDNTHAFEAGKPEAVCRNTADMLSKTRLKIFFDVSPEKKHYGIFDCSPKGNSPNIDNGCGPGCC